MLVIFNIKLTKLFYGVKVSKLSKLKVLKFIKSKVVHKLINALFAYTALN